MAIAQLPTIVSYYSVSKLFFLVLYNVCIIWHTLNYKSVAYNIVMYIFFTFDRKYLICVAERLFPSLLKFRYCKKATKLKKNLPLVLNSLNTVSPKWEMFYKLLWPSHNIWTLMTLDLRKSCLISSKNLDS
jgi:hypothetical protein